MDKYGLEVWKYDFSWKACKQIDTHACVATAEMIMQHFAVL